MPDATPAGPLAIALDAIRTLISGVPAFQTWTGAADAAHALPFIFVGEVGWPIQSITIVSHVLTIKTREPHTVSVADVVTVEGASLGDESSVTVDGEWTVATVAGTSITATTSLADLPECFPDSAFVLPCVRPFVVICESDTPVSSTVIGTAGAAIHAGSADILLEADVSAAYVNDSRNALTEARNALGSFVQGLAETQGTADYACLNTVETVVSPQFVSRPEQDSNAGRFSRWKALVRVTWGLQG